MVAAKCSKLPIHVLVIFISVVLFSSFSAEEDHKKYYVTPENQTSRCNSTQAQKCDTLMNYVKNTSAYFRSNSKFVFLSGVHILQDNATVSVSNVTSLTLIGYDNKSSTLGNTTSKIQCTNQGGFQFRNVTNLRIEKLTIIGCGQVPTATDFPTMAAVLLNNIFNLSLIQMTVQNSTGYGILAFRLYRMSKISGCVFKHNSGTQEYIGGNVAIVFKQCIPKITSYLEIESSKFLNGTNNIVDGNLINFASGLAIQLNCSGINILLNKITMQGNKVFPDSKTPTKKLGRGGNMAMTISFSNTVTIENSTFIDGKAVVGGGLYTSFYIKKGNSSIKLLIINSKFIGNSASHDGGGIHFHFSQEGTHETNHNITFSVENTQFHNNTVGKGEYSQYNEGVAVSIINYYEWGIFKGLFRNCSFKNNGLDPTKRKYTLSTRSAVLYTAQLARTVLIKDSVFESNNATAIAAFRSSITFKGDINITNNLGLDGGGLLLCEASYMILKPHTNITIANNTARGRGGGIYVEGSCSHSEALCFFQIDFENITTKDVNKTIAIQLMNNTAQYAGNQIFGGAIQQCYLKAHSDFQGLAVFQRVFHRSENRLSDIASDPYKVCFCKNNTPDCSIEIWNLTQPIFPGQYLNVSVVTVGQLDGTAPGYVYARLTKTKKHADHKLGYQQTFQYVTNSCTVLNYTIYSNPGNQMLALSVDNPYLNNTITYKSRYLHVTLKPCPLGFQLKKVKISNCKCIDFPDIYYFGFKCNIKEEKITRKAPAWIGYHFANRSSIRNTIDGVIYHSECPFDYCKEGYINITVNSTFLDQDAQCSTNRTGILCGACKNGTSAVFGSTACANCTGKQFTHIIGSLMFTGLGGIALLVVLFACNLTVTEGTISGLLFYVNMFEITRFIFIPHRRDFNLPWYGKPLVEFVAALNFDYGFEACFYDGMTVYMQTWISFIASIYIFALAGMIICLSKKYDWIANRIGHNAVQVLATLFLLFYTKNILCVAQGLSFTTVDFPAPNKSTITKTVWLYNGNIEYLTGKHIPLFIFCITIGILSLFYTFLLLFIQPLERYSHRRCLKWVAAMKPLADAYSSPHIIKEEYRFWNGLLLLFRIIFVALAVRLTNNPQLYLNMVTSSCVLLLSIAWSLGGIYKKRSLNFLTAFFILNLALLSIVTAHEINEGTNTSHVHNRLNIHNASLISQGIAALTFLGILIYHAVKLLKKCTCCNKVLNRVRQIGRTSRNQVLHEVGQDSAEEEHEPLIESFHRSRSYTTSDQYCEPQSEASDPDTY